MNKVKPRFFNHRKPPPPPPPTTVTTTKSFNAIINRLSSSGAHRDVLLTYTSMVRTNTPPDAYTFPNILKACTSLKLFSYGISFHQQVIANGYSSDPFIASSLINFYTKFDYINRARHVFDKMPERNVVPWTAIIACYSRAGDMETTFLMYNQMRWERVDPSSVTMLAMLSGVSEGTHVQCLHACIVKPGFGFDLHVENSLLSVYGKCGRFEDSRKLFELMGTKDIVSWNSLVSGYAMVGSESEVLHLLGRIKVEGLIEPDEKTFGSVVSVLARRGNLEMGRLVHAQIVTSGFELDVQVETSLIVMYLKCGDVDAACCLFERSKGKDVISWTAMISGLVQNEYADKGLMVFQRMLNLRVMPSAAALASALAACAQLDSLKLGTSIHGYLLRQRMLVDIPTQNSLVTMYAKCDHLQQSCAVFDMMDERDVVSWNAIVAGHAQNGHLSKALYLFSEMRTTHQRPDSITVVSLLQASASIGALDQGKWIHNFVISSCLGPCLLIDTALVDMYSKCGDLDTARKCFDRMSQRDLVSWSTMIAGYGCHGKGGIALEMYGDFLRTRLQPNHIIFLSILCACSHNGLVDQGISLFDSMEKDFGIEPKLEHCASVVDLLSRAGRVVEAYDFYKRNFPEPMVDVLGIILDACRASGSKEVGDSIAKDMLVLKPANSGNYVQIAHNYASMAIWDSVGEAWSQMRSLGLRKLPAWSSIEINGKITSFFMADSSHPQHEDIVLLLKSLNMESRKLGINCKRAKFLQGFENL